MNYSINQAQGEYTIVVYDIPETIKNDINQLNTNHYEDDPAFKKLVGYAEKRNISVYEMALIESKEDTASYETKSWDVYYHSESKSIMINNLVPASVKVDALLNVLCLREVFNNYWYLLFDGTTDSEKKFKEKVRKLINRVTKLVDRTKANAA